VSAQGGNIRGPERRGEDGQLRLWPVGWALAACFTAAIVGLGVLTFAALALLHFPKTQHPGTISTPNLVSVLQLVFASVAGAGALVALVMAYRRQRVAEASSAHDRTRVLNERFIAIATQIGNEQPAVRLAGVHALAGLADDWEENRQTCVDVLCAYLRMPYKPNIPDEDILFRANREVRHTVIRIIGNHLRNSARVSWKSLNLDFTGVLFDGGDFTGVEFTGGTISFKDAEFSDGIVDFNGAEFSDGTVDFSNTKFSGGTVNFHGAKFSGGTIDFISVKFSGCIVNFNEAEISDGIVNFNDSLISDGMVSFNSAKFSGGIVFLNGAEFSDGTVDFIRAEFSGGLTSFGSSAFSGSTVRFNAAKFSGGTVDFNGSEISLGTVDFNAAEFYGGTVDFNAAKFYGGTVDFNAAKFSAGIVNFRHAEFSGGTINLRDPTTWSLPPLFDSITPPSGVTLPSP
jgi:uncharacterized protein YjbI with pentapeptide repeats